ncbi:MAG: hypothetical protein A3H96_25025 [Acidobacteria bacterium RIFCSPLOWO2_02_FULL_67_36]|nr:MAG: hypothetical protein A3H96_25025 [Acidobacteria bacterium RIFCSPLOWO2_02_FULL_67_36]OFW25700.1 MAG: hypothetical protein A3G21_24385 [Acidobacteria bacterium RIFCSPLOWO2_12_FULL_66_21]
MALSIAAVAAASAGLGAQSGARADADYLRRAYDTYKSMAQSSPYRGVPWQYLGPTNVSGRATDIAVADRDGSRRVYAGYAASGVWKTDDDGATWQVVFENYASTSIGDLAVAPSNPDVLWVGTGEANIFRASMPGVGMYKSVDAGRTFTHMGLADTQTIARVIVHPTDPEIVYVAASGHEWTDNEMRGVFKTTDGGKTWTKSFYRSPRTGAIDLVMDPSDPNTLYAAMWQRVRRKWSDPRVEPGYSEGGVWKTADGGATWAEVSQGLPAPQFRGRIGIDISRTKPNVLYAFVDSYEPGRPPQPNETDAYGRPVNESRIKSAEIYRTDDKGATWRRVSESNSYMMNLSNTYGWVFGQIRVDPTDENTIYTLGVGLHVSHDAGKTFARVSGTHGDHHGLWIDPKNSAILYNVNDGGCYVSQDAGKTWRFAVSVGGAHFYNVALDTSTPFWVYGSIQDHGSRRGKVDLSNGRDKIPAVAWTNAPGGEGSHQAIDWQNPDVVYSHGFYGNFTREDQSIPMPQRGRGGQQAMELQRQVVALQQQLTEASGRLGERHPEIIKLKAELQALQSKAAAESAAQGRGEQAGRGGPQRSTNIRPKDAELRAQWMASVIVSPHNSNTIYVGYQHVYRSKDKGATWERISPDLTSNDPKQLLPKSMSEIPYQTVVALAESPRKAGVIYAGTDDGHLHVTQDDGKTWTDLTAKLPVRKWISRVAPSQHADGTLYVSQRGREDDDFAPYVYKSTDFGKTFTRIAANLPAGPVNVIREDPKNPARLFVGTDFGAFVSTNTGGKWEVLGGGLPSVQVSDLQIQGRDNIIVVSTYGRGMYALDLMKLPSP